VAGIPTDFLHTVLDTDGNIRDFVLVEQILRRYPELLCRKRMALISQEFDRFAEREPAPVKIIRSVAAMNGFGQSRTRLVSPSSPPRLSQRTWCASQMSAP
jgi:hypothetical protein